MVLYPFVVIVPNGVGKTIVLILCCQKGIVVGISKKEVIMMCCAIITVFSNCGCVWVCCPDYVVSEPWYACVN